MINNTAIKTDPTQSKTLRKQYSAEAYKRFRNLKGLVNKSIIENDAFNIKQKSSKLKLMNQNKQITTNIKPAYDFPGDNNQEKLQEFQDWLQKAIDDEILELTDSQGNILQSAEHWQKSFVRSAYSKGIYKARTVLKSKGLQLPEQRIVQMFNAPIHAESLEALFMRNFNELKGITDAMSQQIMRELADGMARGYNPKKIARLINNRIDKIGITRARMLARTEVIRAFNDAALNQYQQAGITQVEPEVEWLHAMDACESCVSMAQKGPYKISEARGLIPWHPNCRCSWIPLINTSAA